jgi:hypothetical protein
MAIIRSDEIEVEASIKGAELASIKGAGGF